MHNAFQHIEHRAERERKRLAKLKEQKCTFKPQIPTSTASRGASYAERMYDREQSWKRLTADRNPVKLLRMELKKQMELRECTFSPKMSFRAKKNWC